MSSFAANLNSLPSYEREFYLRKLAQVLIEADDIDTAYRLVSESAWMQAHVTFSGHYGDYLKDVSLTWQKTDEIEAPTPVLIGRQIRYALLQAHVNSVSDTILPTILRSGLQAGRWSSDAALVFARQATHPILRVNALTQVGAFLREQGKEELAREALTEALAGLREIDLSANHLEALEALIPLLPPDLIVDALFATQEIGDTADRAKLLTLLAPRLPSEWLPEAFNTARNIHRSDDEATAIAGLVPYLPRHLLIEVLKILERGYGDYSQTKVLVALASHLPPDLYAQAIKAVYSIHSLSYRTAALMAFAKRIDGPTLQAMMKKAQQPRSSSPYMFEEAPKDATIRAADVPPDQLSSALESLMGEALGVARDASDIDDRAYGVALLAPYLPQELLSEAVKIARAITDHIFYDASSRRRALVGLAPYLTSELQAAVIAEIRRWHRTMGERADVLAALAPHLQPELMGEALEAARDVIRETYHQDKKLAKSAQIWASDNVPGALVSLVPYLPPPQLAKALEATREIMEGGARGYALNALVPYLPGELLPEAIDIARGIEIPGYRAMALATLSQRDMPSLFDEAVSVLEAMEEPDESVEALPILLANLAAIFPKDQQPAVFDEAVASAREIDDPHRRAEALIIIAEELPTEQRQQVLSEALVAARDTRAPHARAAVLLQLVPKVPPEQRPDVVADAIAAGQEIEFGEDTDDQTVARAMLLPMVASSLSPRLLKQAIKAARKVANPALRGQSLALLAPHLPADQQATILAEGLAAAREIDENLDDRIRILTHIVPHLSPEQQSTVYVEILTGAREVSPRYWDELGSTLAQLVRQLPSSLIPEMLSLAREIGSAEALIGLIPQLPPDEHPLVFEEAVTAVNGIRSPAARVPMLASLVPLAPANQSLSLVEHTLTAIQSIDVPTARVSALKELAPVWAQLPAHQAYTLWKQLLHEGAAHRRSFFLTDLIGLVPLIAKLGGAEALVEMASAVLDICRHNRQQLVTLPKGDTQGEPEDK